MNFLKYITEELLLEKISKKELEIALNNNNILVGAEFEFKCDEMKIDNATQNSYDDAIRGYRRFKTEFDNYFEEYNSSVQEEQRLAMKLDELENELDELETESDIEENKIKQEIEDVEDELRDCLAEREYLQIPYPNQSYMDFVDQHMGYYVNDIEERIYSLEGNIPEPELPENYLETEDGWLEVAENVLPSLLDSATWIDNYEIGGYDSIKQSVGSDLWAVEYDHSISDDGGVEIKSPPMPLKEFLEMCPKMFKWINKHGDTDNECGFHIHMSIKGISDLNGKIDFVKLMLFTEEGLIYKFFESRKLNTYCISKIDKENHTIDDLKNVLNSDKIYKWGSNHYDAINFQNIKEGHIEFRYMGGTSYHKKWTEVRRLTGMYSFVMSVAMDDSYKRKEYIQKSIRVINKKLNSIRYRAIKQTLVHYAKNKKYSSNTIRSIVSILDKYTEKYDIDTNKLIPYDKKYNNIVDNYSATIIKDINKKLKLHDIT